MLTQRIQILTDTPVGGRTRKAGETLYLDRRTSEFLIKCGLGVEVSPLERVPERAIASPPPPPAPTPPPPRPILKLKRKKAKARA